MLTKNLVADDGSLNLEQALIIALLVLIAAATLIGLGNAIATKYTEASGYASDPQSVAGYGQ